MKSIFFKSFGFSADGTQPVITVPADMTQLSAFNIVVSNNTSSRSIVSINQGTVNPYATRLVVGANQTLALGGNIEDRLMVFSPGGTVGVEVEGAGEGTVEVDTVVSLGLLY